MAASRPVGVVSRACDTTSIKSNVESEATSRHIRAEVPVRHSLPQLLSVFQPVVHRDDQHHRVSPSIPNHGRAATRPKAC
eukprot:scaffold1213_cov256-Pinguiococcus_pyrenoidosus.AAC.9